MKKIITSLFILLCVTGCWNYKELNNYSIVTGMAIDKGEKEGEYEVSVLISNSPKNNSNGGNSESQIVVYTEKGDSIVRALKEISLISPNELYMKSFSVLIISEEVARDEIKTPLDFFYRYSSARKNFNIVIAKDNKAKDTLKIMSPLTNFPSQSISDNLDSTSMLQGIVSKTDFNTLLSTLLRDGIEPIINGITIIGNIEEGSDKGNLETSSPNAYLKIQPLAIFKGDKLIDWTTEEESVGINIINNEINEMYIKVNYNNGYIVVDTTSFSSNISVNIKNDIPIVNLNLKGQGKIIEANGNIDLEDSKIIEKLEKEVNKEIKRFVNLGMSKAIENKSDIFGFGLKFYQNYPEYFNKVKKEWDNNLDKIKLNINSNLIFENKVSAKNSLEEIYDK